MMAAKIKLSEIRALDEELLHGNWLERQAAKHMLCARGAVFAPYLLGLVSRLGKVLEGFDRRQEFPCDYCLVVCEEDGSVRHEKGCPDQEARALLKEIEL
jgi:hypothetical protein